MADKKKSRARALAGDRGWIGFLRIALLPGLLGLAFFPLTVLDWLSESARTSHTRIDAPIENLSTHETSESMGRSRGAGTVPVYHATAIAKFEAGGKPYACELKIQSHDPALIAAFTAAHAKGATMPVWYDPADPSKASGVAPNPGSAATRAALALALALGGIGLFMVGRSPPEPEA